MKSVALLSGIAALLGSYLCYSGAGIDRWIGLAVVAAGAGALLICVRESKRQESSIYELHGQIADFLEGRDETPRFSVDDDNFALLENAVVELESRLLLERDHTRREYKKNANFIIDVSHQLKTPLTALKLYCEMEHRNNPGEHTQKQLVLIERMEHLIYSLLRLEKLRAGAYELQFAPYDLADLTRQVWEELQTLYPEKKCIVTGKATMRCDAYWMGEALKNIFINSCRHTPPDGRIEVSLTTADVSITVTFEDEGGGVAEEEVPKLFQRFYRSSRGTPGEGVGIGLAITRTIVEKHHGTVYAENTARGLKIILCFPILDGALAIG